MIFKWIVHIIEKNTGRKVLNQILEKLKPNLNQQMKSLKIIKILKIVKRMS